MEKGEYRNRHDLNESIENRVEFMLKVCLQFGFQAKFRRTVNTVISHCNGKLSPFSVKPLGFPSANNFYLIETKDQIHFYNR